MKKFISVLIIATLVLGTMGCGASTVSDSTQKEQTTDNQTSDNQASNGQASDSQASGGTFILAREASTTSFDLHQEITMNNAFAIDKVFEPLVNFDQEGNIVDYLASSHEISDDGLVYTFILRDGLKFSDGTDVTSEDVVFSINRHLELGGALPIEADVKSVEATDEKTVVITLGTAFTPFISELANFSNGIIPKDFGGKSEEDFFNNPVGTGPFVVDEWDRAGDLTFIKNEYYWQEGKPYLDKLVYKIVSDDSQVLNQLNAGEIDGTDFLSLANTDAVANGADTTIVSSSGWNVDEIFFNTLEEHLSDVHVRRAIALSLDREAITQALTFGYATKADSVLPNSIRYNSNETISSLDYNLEAAKEELAKSAYPDGFDITINIPSGNNTRMQQAQIIQAAVSKIGINMEINAEEIATFREDFFNFNFDIMINNATADFPDADSIMAFQVNPEGWSQCYWTSYNNPDAVELMKKGQTLPDGDERAKAYAELQQILADDVPYIPLYYPSVIVGVRKNVSGLIARANGSISFENVSVN